MTNQTLDMPLTTPEAEPTSNIQSETQQLLYSVGVMAYNEEANILRTLRAIIEQESRKTWRCVSAPATSARCLIGVTTGRSPT